MPDLDAFEATVKEKMKLLAAKDARTRRQAAAWLGEAGDPTAITTLAQAYKNDPDVSVRETARYALGMFRKLEQELDGPNSGKTVRLLQDIALKGKMGGRPAIAVRSLVKLELGLLISAILVGLLSFVLPSVIKPSQTGTTTVQNITPPTVAPSASDKDRATLLTEIRQMWTSVAGDAGTLQQEFQTAQGGAAMGCTAFLNNPQAYALSPNNRSSYGDIAEIVDLLNNGQSSLSSAETAYQQACNAGGKLTSDQAGQQITALQTMMGTIPEIGQKLAAAESATSSQPSAAPAATISTATQPPVEATAAVNIRPHLVALQTIIDNMTSLNGPNSLLNQYWTESKGPTGTAGCTNQVLASAIPADYVLPADMQSVGNLTLAVGLVNTGLEAVRQGRDLFSRSCPNPVQFADSGLNFATTATSAFTTASNLIASLKNGS